MTNFFSSPSVLKHISTQYIPSTSKTSTYSFIPLVQILTHLISAAPTRGISGFEPTAPSLAPAGSLVRVNPHQTDTSLFPLLCSLPKNADFPSAHDPGFHLFLRKSYGDACPLGTYILVRGTDSKQIIGIKTHQHKMIKNYEAKV